MTEVAPELPPVVAGMALPDREPTLPSPELGQHDEPAAGAIWLPEGDQPGVAALARFNVLHHGTLNRRLATDRAYHQDSAAHKPDSPLGKLAAFLGINHTRVNSFNSEGLPQHEYYSEFPGPHQVNEKIDQLNEQLNTTPFADEQPLLPRVETYHGGAYSAVHFLQSYLRGSYLLADGGGDQSNLTELYEAPVHLAWHDVVLHLGGRLVQSPSYVKAAKAVVRQAFLDAGLDPLQTWDEKQESPYQIIDCAIGLDAVVASSSLGRIAATGKQVEEDGFFPYSSFVGLDKYSTTNMRPKLQVYIDESVARLGAINEAIDAIAPAYSIGQKRRCFVH